MRAHGVEVASPAFDDDPGFGQGVEDLTVEEELAERRRAYRSALKNLLDTMDPAKLVATMTEVVTLATDDGDEHGPALIADLVDSYEVETQGFLQKESENIAALIERVREAAPRGEKAVEPIMSKLETVARNWDSVAQPIQSLRRGRSIRRPTGWPWQWASFGLPTLQANDSLASGMPSRATPPRPRR